MDIPDDDAEAASRGHVCDDAQADGSDRKWHHDLHSLPLAVAQPLAVAPCRQLDTRWLSDAHEVVPLPPDQRDLIGGRGNPPRLCGAGNGLDTLETIIEWSEIPAAAARANDPQPALSLIEGDTASDAETRGSAITVERRITESTTAKHL